MTDSLFSRNMREKMKRTATLLACGLLSMASSLANGGGHGEDSSTDKLLGVGGGLLVYSLVRRHQKVKRVCNSKRRLLADSENPVPPRTPTPKG